MPIDKINVLKAAKNLEQPFLVVDLAGIDEFAARLFVSQGMVAWHKHVDQEQLFLVLDGELALETEWGNTTLRSGEMAVVPKAVTHRCGSASRTTALVFERRFFSNRKNGQRWLFVLEGAGEIKPVNIESEALNLKKRAVARPLVTVDELTLAVILYEDEAHEHLCGDGSELLLVQEGSLTLETDSGTVTLGRGEMATIPKGTSYRVLATERAVALLATKAGSEENQH